MTPAQTRDALVRVTKFVDEYQKMRGLHPDNIHSLHFGMERGAILTVSDLRTLLAALPVGDGEPVASAVSSADYWQRRGHHVCPDCAGTRVRSYRQADHLGGQYVDVPCSTCTTPPPAAVPAGWLRAIDDALVVSWIGTAESADTYEQARDKLHKLISQEIAIATDPAVNGGFVLVPVEPTQAMLHEGRWEEYGESSMRLSPVPDDVVRSVWDAMLAARPDAPAGEKGT